MRQLEIAAVGRLSAPFLREGCAEYQKRLAPLCRLELTELPETRLQGEGPAAEQRVIEAEGDRFLELLQRRKKVYTIAMCVEGRQLSSPQLAERIREVTDSGSRALFLIGGSLGLSQRVKDRADLCLSISAMTLPHQLARLVLLEQVYRSLTIIGNIKYHK